VTEALANGETACPVCGWRLKLSKQTDGKKSWRFPRTRLWIMFACFIVGTPVASLIAQDFMSTAMFYIGALGGGFTLAKIYAKKPWTFWVLGIAFSLCIAVVFALAFLALIAFGIGHNSLMVIEAR